MKTVIRALATVPALVALLTASMAGAADHSHAASYSESVRQLARLEKSPGSTRDEWRRLIQSFLSIHRTEKKRAIAGRSLFLAGRAALALYRRDGKIEDLDAAIQYLSDFTETYRKDRYFIVGLKELKEADTLRRKTAELPYGQGGLSHRTHASNKAEAAESLSGELTIHPRQNVRGQSASTSQAETKGNWNHPASRCTGNPFWAPRPGARAQDTDSSVVSIGPLAITDILPSRSVSPLASQEAAVTGASDKERSAGHNPPPVMHPPPQSPTTTAPPLRENEKKPKALSTQHRITSVAPSMKPESEIEQKRACSPKGYVVVIDPGHGGKDPGAVSRDGTLKEKDITLDVAKRVKAVLERTNPGIAVTLTRSDDRFMTLEERTAAANSLNADLFISVHCNSDTDSSSAGTETYYLSTATSGKAMRVAARENNVPLAKMTDLQATLLDLMVSSKKTESEELATAVNNSLERVIPKCRHRGVKQAPFYVLLGAKMPAILVECAFISNSREGRKLHSPQYLDTIAQGLADGANSYLQGLGEKG